MTQDEFRQYIDYLERTCGMHRCFSATLPGGSCLLGFEGSRTHAPFHVQSEHASKTVSLLIDYRKAEDGFDVRLIAAGKPYPSIPPMPKNTYERIYLTEETYQACRKYMRKGTIHTSFCDPNEAAPPKPEPYPPDPEGDWDCRI